MNPLLVLVCLILLIQYTFESLKFTIPTDREKCFLEELNANDSLLIRWDVAGLPEDELAANKTISSIKLFIRSLDGLIIHSKALPERKNKIALYPNKEGMYEICVRYYETWGDRQPKTLYMGLKLSTEYTQEANYAHILGKDSIQYLDKKMGNIIQALTASSQVQDKELQEETITTQTIIESSKLYFNLTIIQLIAVVGIGLYHIFTFKRYLKVNRII